MKRSLTLILAFIVLVSCCTAASADKYDILKPMWLNALENAQAQKEAAAPQEKKEPKVVSGDDQLEVQRYAVYTEDEYSTEAYVYAQLKNVGESIIRPSEAALIIRDASGKQVAKEDFADFKPDVVMPGESLFVTEWLYNFVSDLDKVDSIEVTIERSEYSRKKIEKLEGVKAYVEGDYLCAELTNTTDAPVYDASVVALALDSQGKILDALSGETYSNLGIAPGSTVIFRKYLEQHAADFPGAACEAQGYLYIE